MNLLKGYKLLHETDGTKEILFAQYEDGTIKTCTRDYSTSFHQKEDIWTEATEIPRQAEFIGKYKEA